MPKIDNNVVMEALYHLIDRLQIYAFFFFFVSFETLLGLQDLFTQNRNKNQNRKLFANSLMTGILILFVFGYF